MTTTEVRCREQILQAAALLTAREACDILSQAIEAQPVQCIGSRFVLYKRNEENPVIALE